MVRGTKELIIDFRQKKEPLNPIFINGRPIEVVDSYNYLGVLIHKDLDWEPHAQATYKKMNQRLYFLRKLNTFNINCKILHLFSRSTIESVLMFCIIGWGGNCNVSLKKRFDRLPQIACSHLDGGRIKCSLCAKNPCAYLEDSR